MRRSPHQRGPHLCLWVTKRHAAWLASVLLPPVLTGCTGTDTVSTVDAVSAPGLTSPFTPNCQSIRINAVTAGQVSYVGTLSSSRTRLSSMPGFPTGTTVTALCLDGGGQATGSATTAASSNRLTAGSGEGSAAAAEYAKTHATTGIFPLITAR